MGNLAVNLASQCAEITGEVKHQALGILRREMLFGCPQAKTFREEIAVSYLEVSSGTDAPSTGPSRRRSEGPVLRSSCQRTHPSPSSPRPASLLRRTAAQAHGGRWSGFKAGCPGTFALTCFYPDEGMGVFDGGGATLTDDEVLASQVSARASVMDCVHEVGGINSRLDTMRSVVLCTEWTRLDVWNAALLEATQRWSDLLDDLPGSRLPRSRKGDTEVWNAYVVRLADCGSVQAYLVESAIGAVLHCPTPGQLTDAYAHHRWGLGSTLVKERAANELQPLADVPGLAFIESTV